MWNRLKHFPFLATGLLALLIWRLVAAGLSWVGLVALGIASLWFGIGFVRWLVTMLDRPVTAHDQVTPERESAAPLVSLVFFLEEARTVSDESIRECVSHAIGTEVSDEPGTTPFVARHPVITSEEESESQESETIDQFIVQLPEGLFSVLISGKAYVTDPGGFARESIRDKRLRRAVECHRAWIAVDLMDEVQTEIQSAEAYRIIGKLLASMAGPDCLAIYSPGLQRCNEFDPSLIEALAGPDPLSLFDEPTFEPIIEISDNDPRMEAAVAEATRRWPEFVEAFETRSEPLSDQYLIKAEFREAGNCEYMWVAVTDVIGSEIRGTLMNDPHELMEIHRGSSVRIEIDRLNDWIYPTHEGAHVGGFTLDVLADAEGD